jgi:hypothetical protein
VVCRGGPKSVRWRERGRERRRRRRKIKIKRRKHGRRGKKE